MECPSCQADIPADSRFCIACGAALALVCSACGHANPARANFCATCGQTLSASHLGATAPRPAPGPAPPHSSAERRQLTVMFCDLVGSTALAARMDPEDLSEVIRAYESAAAAEIARFDGRVAKFLGDGILAYFGWPQAHEEDAERAVRAALAITEAVTWLRVPSGEPLAVRIGIATGLVVVGDLIGEGAAREETVVGETPNLAARLQALAEPNAVVIGRRTRTLIGGLFDLQELGGFQLKGFALPIQAWRVLREGAAESRFEAQQAAGLTPLVGREQELALLLDRWQQAKEGEGQAVLLEGEPGIGKSRLVRALREVLGDECRPARNTQDVSPTLSAMTVPSVRSRSSAMRTSSTGTSSSFSASGTSSSVGKPQCPSSIASVSA
jgi:class 3 adenylate cyclase